MANRRHGKRESRDSGIGSSPPHPRQSSPLPSRRGPSTGHGHGHVQQILEDVIILPREVASKLSALGREFAVLDYGDYAGCRAFIKNNPEILKEASKDFVAAAQAALRADKRSIAESCLQQSLLLRDCKDEEGKVLSRQDRAEYFEHLIRKDEEALEEFESDFDEAMKRLEKSVGQAEKLTPQPATTQTGRTSFTYRPAPDRHDDSTSSGPLASLPSSAPRTHESMSSSALPLIPVGTSRTHESMSSDSLAPPPFSTPRTHDSISSGSLAPFPLSTHRTHQTPAPEVERAGALSRRNTVTSVGSNALSGPSLRAFREVGEIDHRYQEEKSVFFVVGRVFAILWHLSCGSGIQTEQDTWVQIGRFRERIISHIQRMVVVKEEHGCSWCIPINTYNGHGVAKFTRKPPFTAADRRDVEAHAIIYMRGCRSTRQENEPKMTKESIMVTPAGPDQKLDEMSRVNFAKVHTVEHNVKVMNVGKVERESLQYLKSYWRARMNEALTHNDRQPRR